MRAWILAAALVATAAPAAAAPAGSAQNFLDRVNRLKGKGPLALFDSDMGRLKNEATAVGKAIGNERRAAEAAGKPILYCSPQPKAELGQNEFIAGLEAIPANERSRISLHDAMLRILQKKYPCKR